ncbi:MAG: hypothetical protein LBQ79_03595 [Deltaproteobacteria bacterium]|nr:hypothetical protein [Deltaproteobacteria bacterium]
MRKFVALPGNGFSAKAPELPCPEGTPASKRFEAFRLMFLVPPCGDPEAASGFPASAPGPDP